MVMLLFYVGEERYACECDHVLEVIPRVPLKLVAHAPPFLAGLLRYAGLLVPVLDFVQLRDGRPSVNVLSTRIMMIQGTSQGAIRQLMGLMVECLTETLPQTKADFTQHNMSFQNAPYLTGVYDDDRGVIQMVDTERLFPIVHNIFSEV